MDLISPTNRVSDVNADSTWLLRVTDLKQYDYCPRIVYYEYCLPGVRPTTYKMEAGAAAQERIEDLEQRRSLRTYGVTSGVRHFNVPVRSEELGCSGRIDLVIEETGDGEASLIPVDFKLSRKKPGEHFRLQLACYAIMLEEGWRKPVRRGYIYLIPNKEAVRVDLSARLRQRAMSSVEEIRRMIENQRIPAPTPRRAQCVECEFRRFCGDTV